MTEPHNYKDTIRILLVEDSADDAELLDMVIRGGGLKATFQQVDSIEDFRDALRRADFDLILSDYRLPGFSGLEALRIYRESSLQVPFFLVSGTIGEEAAVECLKSGAHDYIMKGNLKRLVPAIRRALQDFAERAVHRAAERRYRQIVEQASEGIWVVDLQGCVLMSNQRLAQILHCPSQMLPGFALFDLMSPQDRAHLLTFPSKPLVMSLRRPPGAYPDTPLWASLTATPMFDEVSGCDAIMGTLTDVTQTKQLETQLMQAQKMESLGRLAGGIAHDFNNLLSVIIGFTEIIVRDTSPDGVVLESFYEVLRAARQGADLTRQLLVLGRRQAPAPHGIGINGALEELRQMLQRLLGPDITLTYVLRAAPDIIPLDRTAFAQIVLNLVINARDAMPGAGQIQVETGNCQAGRVLLSVSDQGEGIAPEVLESIFEPFFTTKPVNKGTGLGLSTVFSIVEQSKGSIEVQSVLSKGTTFSLSWPPGEGTSEVVREVRTATEKTHTQTILVVEDSDPVRQVFVSLLEREGYQVLQADNGAEALRLEERHPGPIDMLLTDVIMPGMKGTELARLMRQRRSNLRVILTSGFGTAGDENREVGDEFLEKPVEADQLLEKVQAVLCLATERR